VRPETTAALGELIVTAVHAATADLRTNTAALVARLADIEARALVTERDHGATRERLAAVEARPAIPGPAGADGAPGADGFTVDEMIATVDPGDDRLVTLSYRRGEVTKPILSFRLGVPSYCGLFENGHTYERGDLVTLAGCVWHCNAATSRERPGNGSKDWTLAVKCGRDGKDAPRAEARP
jgi:hypothetical protein